MTDLARECQVWVSTLSDFSTLVRTTRYAHWLTLNWHSFVCSENACQENCSETLVPHIFQNTLATTNNAEHTKRHQFLAQFFMPLCVVWPFMCQSVQGECYFQKPLSDWSKLFSICQWEVSNWWLLTVVTNPPGERAWKFGPKVASFLFCVPLC